MFVNLGKCVFERKEHTIYSKTFVQIVHVEQKTTTYRISWKILST